MDAQNIIETEGVNTLSTPKMTKEGKHIKFGCI